MPTPHDYDEQADNDLQKWLDAQEPDQAHVKAKEQEYRRLVRPRTFAQMRAAFDYQREVKAYADAIGVACR